MAKNKKKPAVKKSPVKKKAPAKKAPVKKSGPKKAVAKKAVAAKGSSKKPVVKKVVAKETLKKASKAVTVKAPAKTAATVQKPLPGKMTAPQAFATKSTKKVELSKTITPLDDRVIVQPVPAEKMTPGGLYIPDTVSTASGNMQGFVVSVGRGRCSKKGQVFPMDLKVGDKVMFAEHSGSIIEIQDQELRILRESDVLGVVG